MKADQANFELFFGWFWGFFVVSMAKHGCMDMKNHRRPAALTFSPQAEAQEHRPIPGAEVAETARRRRKAARPRGFEEKVFVFDELRHLVLLFGCFFFFFLRKKIFWALLKDLLRYVCLFLGSLKQIQDKISCERKGVPG